MAVDYLAEPSLRLVLEFTRSDHPRLFDDLSRFPKGARRINRLRLLAHDGLLAQTEQLRPAVHELKPAPPPVRATTGQEGRAAVTNSIFLTDDDGGR